MQLSPAPVLPDKPTVPEARSPEISCCRKEIEQFSTIVRGEIARISSIYAMNEAHWNDSKNICGALATLAELTNRVSQPGKDGKTIHIRALWQDNMERFIQMAEVSEPAREDVQKILSAYQSRLRHVWETAIFDSANEISERFQTLIRSEEPEKAIMFAIKLLRKWCLANELDITTISKADELPALSKELVSHFVITPWAEQEEQTVDGGKKGESADNAQKADGNGSDGGPGEKPDTKKAKKIYTFGEDPIDNAALKGKLTEVAKQKLPPGAKVERKHVIGVLGTYLSDETTGTNASRVANMYNAIFNDGSGVRYLRPRESQALLALFDGKPDFLLNKEEIEKEAAGEK